MGMSTHSQGDQLLVTGEDLQALTGCPEHPVDIVDRQVARGNTSADVIPSASGHRYDVPAKGIP